MIMKIPDKAEERLLDYLDGTLSENEKAKFEVLLRTNAGLKELCTELHAVETSARSYLPEQPSKNFTGNVMKAVRQMPSPSTPPISNTLMLLGAIMVLITVAIFLLSTGVFDESATIQVNELVLIKEYVVTPLVSVNVNPSMVMNVIIFLNLAIALIVLDRSVLKPYFQRRMQGGV